MVLCDNYWPRKILWFQLWLVRFYSLFIHKSVFAQCSDLYSPKIVIYTIESVGAMGELFRQRVAGLGACGSDRACDRKGWHHESHRVSGQEFHLGEDRRYGDQRLRGDSHAAAGNIKSQESCVRPWINSNIYKIMPGWKSWRRWASPAWPTQPRCFMTRKSSCPGPRLSSC